MKKEYVNTALYKALKNAGFSDEYISSQSDLGAISFEKSMSEEGMEDSEKKEKKNLKNDKEHVKDLEDDEDKDTEDVKDLEDDEKLKKAKKDKKDKKDLEKSQETVDLMKSMQTSFVDALKEVFQPQFDEINKSIEKIGSHQPAFKSEGLENASFIEKSLDGMKDDSGKLSVSVTRQRAVAKSLIEKAIDGADDELMKSIGEDAKNYLINPEAVTIGENLARYMFTNKQVKFVQ